MCENLTLLLLETASSICFKTVFNLNIMPTFSPDIIVEKYVLMKFYHKMSCRKYAAITMFWSVRYLEKINNGEIKTDKIILIFKPFSVCVCLMSKTETVSVEITYK